MKVFFVLYMLRQPTILEPFPIKNYVYIGGPLIVPSAQCCNLVHKSRI